MYKYLDDDDLSGPAMQWENLKHACLPNYTPVEDRYMSDNQKSQADTSPLPEAVHETLMLLATSKLDKEAPEGKAETLWSSSSTRCKGQTWRRPSSWSESVEGM